MKHDIVKTECDNNISPVNVYFRFCMKVINSTLKNLIKNSKDFILTTIDSAIRKSGANMPNGIINQEFKYGSTAFFKRFVECLHIRDILRLFFLMLQKCIDLHNFHSKINNALL